MFMQQYQKGGKEKKGFFNCNNFPNCFGFNFSSNRFGRRIHNNSFIGSFGLETLSHHIIHYYCAFDNIF